MQNTIVTLQRPPGSTRGGLRQGDPATNRRNFVPRRSMTPSESKGDRRPRPPARSLFAASAMVSERTRVDEVLGLSPYPALSRENVVRSLL